LKLSKEHIQQLHDFTRKHYVEWYDVQQELVDHLANGIETQWEQNPKLSFEEALEKEFKKFGIFGFMDVVSQTENTMGRKYRRFLINEVKEWFKIPQILSTVAVFIMFFLTFKSQLSEVIILSFYVIFGIWMAYKSFALRRLFKKRRSTSKKWLLEHIIFQQASGVLFIAFVNIFNMLNLTNGSETSIYSAVFMSLLFTIAVIVSVVSLHILPNKADQLLKQTYPTYVTN
jgi:hypothetical protein